jgi:hypothetical protein
VACIRRCKSLSFFGAVYELLSMGLLHHLGSIFGMRQSVANKWLQVLRPVLQGALQQQGMLPSRTVTIMPNSSTGIADSPPFFTMMAPNARSNDR